MVDMIDGGGGGTATGAAPAAPEALRARAAEEFRQATRLAPGNGEVRYNEAPLSLALALGRWDDALKQVNSALAQEPLDP